MSNRPGWYYTEGGRLRYRDDDGWTEHYLTFEEIRDKDWPLPAPMSMLDQVRAQEAQRAASAGRRVSGRRWWRRTR